MNFLHFTTNLLPIVTMIVLEPIGFVHNTCTTSQAPEFIKKEISEIEILPEYSEGLQDIEQAEYLDLVFSFHHEKRTELVTRIRSGEMKGVFASRSPKRPNHLGITTCLRPKTCSPNHSGRFAPHRHCPKYHAE